MSALRLGVHQEGGYLFDPQQTGVYIEGDSLCFSEAILNQHMFVLGQPGAGKTWMLLRLLYEVLFKTNRDVFFVDGKGEGETAQMVRALAYAAQRGRVPVFRLGQNLPGALYNGFRGSKEAIYERLGAMIGLGDPRNDPYWEDVNRELLQWVCGYRLAIEPPRSFEELLERLNIEWLREAYRDNWTELQAIDDYDRKDMRGFMRRMRSFIRPFIDVTDKTGFSLEDAPAAVFSLRTMALRDTGSRFLRFLVEDLTDFIGNRQGRPALLVIDEFGAFGNENIIKVLSMARSAELGVVLATQTVASLGEELIRDTILENVGTYLLMRSPNPEPIATLAGTVMRVEATTHYEEGQIGDKGGLRWQHQYKVDLNKARSLQPGEGFIIRMGEAAKLSISPVDFAREGISLMPAERIQLKQQPNTSAPPQQSAPPPIDPDLEL